MKAFIIAGAAAISCSSCLGSGYQSCKSQQPNGTQKYQAGTGGTSKPGVQGDTGSKNGPAARIPLVNSQTR